MKAVLFDLDGTLLPLDQDAFTEAYMQRLAADPNLSGYEPKALTKAVWEGTYAMIKNDGRRSNEAVFWEYFAGVFGERAREDESRFAEFYRTGFEELRTLCGRSDAARALVDRLKAAGVTIALATNPLFPKMAVESRIRWAGFESTEFALVTTYENCSYCKPNPAYYRDIAERLSLRPEDCLMVGNDVGDDLSAREIGMEVFLLTDCLVNRKSTNLTSFPRGNYAALSLYIDALFGFLKM